MDPNAVATIVAAGSNHASQILGVMIPIIAIVMGLGLGMLKIWTDYRKKREILQAHHAERMAAIEKGIDPDTTYIVSAPFTCTVNELDPVVPSSSATETVTV